MQQRIKKAFQDAINNKNSKNGYPISLYEIKLTFCVSMVRNLDEPKWLNQIAGRPSYGFPDSPNIYALWVYHDRHMFIKACSGNLVPEGLSTMGGMTIYGKHVEL
ncbi:hypothetical protein Mmc1_0381 [Magnetococcus marinus MC-1]|uniref:Uncharacterized protein n=1 Tax=Magnetococcus marinus (strain ATCC BAA-1437 / JCM 17883 / MC-1) TaxID=156889 RepID=A0L4L4_MAGMM|nr:hypothetical protein [Magnetococcus marinus]ABK42907.1 hypothetical protein Mmc1_0381 [Magnetococcus marinus MC-1]